MQQLSRMELADVGSPEALIAAILKQIPDMPLPVPVDEIARALDIEDIRHLETDGFEGSLICTADKNRGTILVNGNRPRQRQRFTTSHELGHFLIPTHRPIEHVNFVCSAADMRRSLFKKGDRAAQMEVEANVFASLLLFPPPIFQRDIAKLRGCDLSHILRLATRYDASKEATTRRYVDTHDEPCAGIVSKNGLIRSIYRPKRFPFIIPDRGSPVPADSVTARFAGPVGELSDWAEIDGAIWLSSDFGKRLPALFEQTLIQKDGFRLTLLNTESVDEEEAEEEASLERSWEVRFHKR